MPTKIAVIKNAYKKFIPDIVEGKHCPGLEICCIINIFRILRILILSLSLVNKSLMISMFPFSTAKYNAVLSNNIKILLNDMILNEIE